MTARQRDLRGTSTTQPVVRMRNSADHQAWLARHVTSRDRWLMRMLFEHKVFTSHQIIDMAFPSRRSANLRLRLLHQYGLVHRFQPHRDTGTHPMHYVLDTAGATLIAHEEGLDPGGLKFSRDREIGRAHSLQLAHMVGCNSLFASLIHRSRQCRPPGRLTAWWSAARCWLHWGDIVTPDGYGRWQQAGREVEWFVEFDMGTEPLTRLSTKVTRYARLATTTGITTPILWYFPTPQREVTARRALLDALQGMKTGAHTPMATTYPGAANDPLDIAEARWLEVSQTTRGRVTLGDLPGLWPSLPERLPVNDNRTGSDLAPPCPLPPISLVD